MNDEDVTIGMDLSPEYRAWMAARRYRIYRSRRVDGRNIDETVETGLTWEQAKRKARELQDAYYAEHPMQTSWSADLFIPELETEQWKPGSR